MAFRFFDDFILVYPLYAVLFAQHGLSASEISLLFVVWSVTGFALEVPTGVLADRFSRRHVLAIGQVVRAIGYLVWWVAPGFPGYAIGFVCWGAQGALESGAFQALVYDELHTKDETDTYSRIMGLGEASSWTAQVVGSLRRGGDGHVVAHRCGCGRCCDPGGRGRCAHRLVVRPPTSQDGGVTEHPAREAWKRLESIHAVAYFCPEPRDAMTAIGLRGFWMGYFGARAAPLGPVPPGVVEAAFFNFAPGMVRRAIPDAWGFASPADILEARRASAAAALRRLFPSIGAVAVALEARLRQIVDGANDAGRVLFAANRDLGLEGDDVERLWLLTTCLREHRGDGHVAALTAAGLDGCEVHALFAADAGLSSELYLESRGWSAEEWGVATDRLAGRGLVHDGRLSREGRELREWIEGRTDELALAPMHVVGDVDELCRDLEPAASAIAASGEIRFPNPMGLPRISNGHI